MKYHYQPPTYPPIKLLCGSMASFDIESGISYRCDKCYAVMRSIGMPKACKELYDMQDVVDKLKGQRYEDPNF
jgi:hypothetical protein